MSNLTKREIIAYVSGKIGNAVKQDVVEDAVQCTLDALLNAMAEGRTVELRNFGVFEVQVRKQRIGRNPNQPDATVIIPRRAVVKFKAGKVLKARLKKLDLAKLTPDTAPTATPATA